MAGIEERLTAWAATASPHARQTGPTAHDLGGIDNVAAHAHQLATSPYLPFLVRVAAHQHAVAPEDAHTLAVNEAVLTGLSTQQRHSAFASAVDELNIRPDYARALGRQLPSTLLSRFAAGIDAADDPAAALIAVEAAYCHLQLILAGVARHLPLLGALDEATADPAALPQTLAARLPRLLGLLDEHYPATGIRDALHRLLILDCSHADAAFELAMADLRDTFECSDIPQMTTSLLKVRARLEELHRHVDSRQDAAIYRAGIDAVLAFGGPDTTTQVRAAASALRADLEHYRAWLRGTQAPPWAAPRYQEIAAWSEIVMALEQAAEHLGDEHWYDPPAALHAILRAYTAGRSVTIPIGPGTAGAAAITQTLIPPAVEAAFLRAQHRRDLLRQALQRDPDLREDPAAQHLHEALRAAKPGSARDRRAEHWPRRGPGWWCRDRQWPHVAATLEPDEFNDLVTNGKTETLDKLELGLRTAQDVEATISDPKYSRLMDRLLTELSTSPDWIPDIADRFTTLLDCTVAYAFHCYDVGRQMGGSYTEYLRERDPAGKKQKVDEKLFHQHYLECMKFSTIARLIQAEVIGFAGGRADIVASFGAVRFAVECKIEENDASQQALRAYAGQAAQYSGPNPAFAILLVLDLTGHAEGSADLFSSIWIAPVLRHNEISDRLVVTIRVPGGRTDPNLVRTPALHR